MADIKINFETAGLNRLAQECSDKIEALARAMPRDATSFYELDRFLRSQRDQCRQLFEDAGAGR
jgi:hypothetical protein